VAVQPEPSAAYGTLGPAEAVSVDLAEPEPHAALTASAVAGLVGAAPVAAAQHDLAVNLADRQRPWKTFYTVRCPTHLGPSPPARPGSPRPCGLAVGGAYKLSPALLCCELAIQTHIRACNTELMYRCLYVPTS